MKRAIVGMVATTGLAVGLFAGAGCSSGVDAEKLQKTQEEMGAAMQKTDSPEEAKKVYKKFRADFAPKWKKFQAARSGMSEKEKIFVNAAATSAARDVCTLKLRGAFDPEAKKTYSDLCQDYTQLVGVSAERASSTLRDGRNVENFVEDMEAVREQVEKGDVSGPAMECAGVKEHAETAEKFGYEQQFKEFKRLCNVEIPVLKVRKALEEAKGSSMDPPIECSAGHGAAALEDLKEADEADPQVVEKLESRWNEVCS